MKLWKCPDCGSGKRAPERPHRADVRRYCLACSESTGRLVARVCPALDGARARRDAVHKERRAAKTARVRAAGVEARTAGGIDLGDVAKRALRLPSVLAALRANRRYWVGDRGPLPPAIHVRRCARQPWGRVGTAWPAGYRMQIVDWPGRPAECLRATMLHECVHLALPSGERHGAAFQVTMRAAAEEWRKQYPHEPLRNEDWADGENHADAPRDGGVA